MMRTLRFIVVIGSAFSAQMWAQSPDQHELAQKLVAASPASERAMALAQMATLAPSNVGEELRAALIVALEREGRLHRERDSAVRRGQWSTPLDNPELILDLVSAAVPLNDPRTIPGLTGALGTGMRPIRALAAFGDSAVRSVVAVVMSSESMTASVDDGLVTLRMMVENQTAGRRLSATSLAEIRRVAEYHLKVPGREAENGVTLRRAIDLAAVLNDASLRYVIQALASDPNESMSRGVVDPRLIEKTQKPAADRLAGVPALPRY
jgi:hypothetical protein